MPLINLKRLMRNQKKYNIELNSGKEATDFVHQRNRLHVNQAPGMAQASGRHDRVPGTYKPTRTFNTSSMTSGYWKRKK